MNVEGQILVIVEAEAALCKNCGSELEHTAGSKRKIFCCDKCRMEWHYKEFIRDGGIKTNGEKWMTLRDKHNIRLLRNLGFGYQKIANDLKIKKHQVRDYCRYHGLTGNAKKKMISELKNKFSEETDASIVKNYCWHCGSETKLTRKFCCDKCRYAYNYSHRS